MIKLLEKFLEILLVFAFIGFLGLMIEVVRCVSLHTRMQKDLHKIELEKHRKIEDLKTTKIIGNSG